MWATIVRELRYLRQHSWDLALVTWVPALLIILFCAMFFQGKAHHLPIAVIDQDQSTLSRNIIKYLEHNETVDIAYLGSNLDDVEQQLNRTKVWGYLHIPSGAEQHLVKAQDAGISIAYNQSFFSIGNSISTAMQLSAIRGIAEFSAANYLKSIIPNIDSPSPHLKVSVLYNPTLNYELYLEAFVVPAILHLLLCCCVAFSVGQEFKFQTTASWLSVPKWKAVLGKNLVYVLIFCLWTWLWLIWMIEVRGWFVAGDLWLILVAQFLMYSAYALASSCIVFITKDLNKAFGLIAVYGGSSLSFSGITLPLNNAPLFTQFWASIIPYTPYAKLQTQQWVIGSPLHTSLPSLLLIGIYVLFYGGLALLLLRKLGLSDQAQGVKQ